MSKVYLPKIYCEVAWQNCYEEMKKLSNEDVKHISHKGLVLMKRFCRSYDILLLIGKCTISVICFHNVSLTDYVIRRALAAANFEVYG